MVRGEGYGDHVTRVVVVILPVVVEEDLRFATGVVGVPAAGDLPAATPLPVDDDGQVAAAPAQGTETERQPDAGPGFPFEGGFQVVELFAVVGRLAGVAVVEGLGPVQLGGVVAAPAEAAGLGDDRAEGRRQVLHHGPLGKLAEDVALTVQELHLIGELVIGHMVAEGLPYVGDDEVLPVRAIAQSGDDAGFGPGLFFPGVQPVQEQLPGGVVAEQRYVVGILQQVRVGTVSALLAGGVLYGRSVHRGPTFGFSGSRNTPLDQKAVAADEIVGYTAQAIVDIGLTDGLAPQAMPAGGPEL